MACPMCDSVDCIITKGEPRFEGGAPDIEFVDVIISCKSCKYSGHYLATKRLNNGNK